MSYQSSEHAFIDEQGRCIAQLTNGLNSQTEGLRAEMGTWVYGCNIGQDGLWIWKCNALRAMANSGDQKYHEYIKEAMEDPDQNIRNTALWACQQLGI